MIDYVLISLGFDSAFVSFESTWNVTWGPHCGMELSLNARPRSVEGRVQCIPRKLPLEQFGLGWKIMDEPSREAALRNASCKAKQILSKQKRKTGVAILGTPIDTLKHDKKFQGCTLKDAIASGEEVALASLTSEILVCDVAGVPSKEHKLYTGRAQYPIFKVKPLIRANCADNKYACPHMFFWGHIKSILAVLSLYAPLSLPVTAATEILCEAVLKLLESANLHCEGAPEDVRALIPVISRSLRLADKEIFQDLINIASNLFVHFLNQCLNSVFKEWCKFVRSQLAMGGGKLFKYIRKTDNIHFNVDWRTAGGQDLSPCTFLRKSN